MLVRSELERVDANVHVHCLSKFVRLFVLISLVYNFWQFLSYDFEGLLSRIRGARSGQKHEIPQKILSPSTPVVKHYDKYAPSQPLHRGPPI